MLVGARSAIDSLGDIDLFTSIAASPRPCRRGSSPSASTTSSCGYDADKAGDSAARSLMRNHPFIVKRRKPEGAKDWNDMIRIAAP